MLSMYDEDFWEIFKVKADFDYEIDKTEENMLDYAAFLSGCCEECEVSAISTQRRGQGDRVFRPRWSPTRNELSSRFAQIKDWIEEANYWADKEKAELYHRQPRAEGRRREGYSGTTSSMSESGR